MRLNATYSNIRRISNPRSVCAAGNRLDSTDWSESNSSTDLKELLPGAGPLPIDKYIYLRDLRSKNPTEYYRLLLEHGGDVSSATRSATARRRGGARPAGALGPHTLSTHTAPIPCSRSAEARKLTHTDYRQWIPVRAHLPIVPVLVSYGPCTMLPWSTPTGPEPRPSSPPGPPLHLHPHRGPGLPGVPHAGPQDARPVPQPGGQVGGRGLWAGGEG